MSDIRGVYRKFEVRRTDGDPGGKHKHCSYWVLDLDHDENALPALKAYAKSCKKTRPQLYKELQQMIALAEEGEGTYFPAPLGIQMRMKLEQEG